MLLLNSKELTKLVLGSHKRKQLKSEDGDSKPSDAMPALGYNADEEKWYGYASGPNKVRHYVSVDLKSGHIHLLQRGQMPKNHAKPVAKSISGQLLLSDNDWGFPTRIAIHVCAQRGPLVVDTSHGSVGALRIVAKKVEHSTDTISGGSKEPAYGHANAQGERWITIHPHGDDHAGYPVKINQNRDGSWRVVGGAGGSLNGLRIHGLKHPSEYKQAAKEKQQEKKQKAAQAHAENEAQIHARHRDDLAKEALESGKTFTPDELHSEAAKRATDELKANKQEREKLGLEFDQERHNAEKEYIAAVAKAHGWESGLNLDDETLSDAREAAKRELLKANPDLLNKGDKLAHKLDLAIDAVQKALHSALLSRAREAVNNHRELIVAAHDEAVESELGDLKVGDLVKGVLGDSGKGYGANIADELRSRGIDSDELKEMADGAAWQNLLDRKGGNKENVEKAREALGRMQEARANNNKAIDAAKAKLSGGDSAFEAVKGLDTTPTDSVGASAKLLAEAKALDDKIKSIKDGKKALVNAQELDTLPKAAVVSAKPLSQEEANARVLNDLNERARTGAVSALHDLYNVQDAEKPLRSHLLAGHNAFFGNIGHIVGVRSPDPLTADILGPSAAAHVFRRSLESTFTDSDGNIDKKQFEAVRQALSEHHIEKQVELCNNAVEEASEMFDSAEKLNSPEHSSLETVEGLLDGLNRNQKRIELLKAGRESVGIALGKMEAAAALNEALMSDRTHTKDGAREDVQVALGAMSMRDAMKQVAAIGLTKPDRHDKSGNLLEAGEFSLSHDGKNAILQIHSSGIDALAAPLRESQQHLERAKVVGEIQAGKHDDSNYVPALFSRRPAIDLSREDGDLVLGDSAVALNLADASTASDIGRHLESHIAQRIEAGQDPLTIASDLRSAAFRSTHTTTSNDEAFTTALNTVLPKPPSRANADTAKAFLAAQSEALHQLHGQWLDSQVASGQLDSTVASVHRQTLPTDWKTRDLAYQIALQDPRLQHAFSDVGTLDRNGRRAVRDYAYEHIFNLDPKDKESPISPLSTAERKAWDGWRELERNHPDPYAAIQQQWRDSEMSDDSGLGGGMFEDFAAEPHPFSTLDLGNDSAVIEAAKRHASELGYESERRVTDLKAGTYNDVVPELEVSSDQPLEKAARDARNRIKGALRAHAFTHMLGAPDLAKSNDDGKVSNPASHFNPSNVATAGERWGEYVRDMGGESRAYRTIQEKMKGDVAGRFAKGYRQIHREEFKSVPVPLSHGDAHNLASLSPEKRAEQSSQKAREAALVRKREGGGFAAEGEGAVASKLDAKRQAEALGPSLFGMEEAKTDSHKQDTHRLSLGASAENTLAGLIPKINLRRGTSAAGDLNFGKANGLKQQRAIKQAVAAKRMQLSLGVGVGKTAVALGTYGEHRQAGKAKRALMVVPSIVQEQFGSEAARFFDPTHKEFPSWVADSGISSAERRASYEAKPGGHDIVVVTHQALRDDLIHALASHKFDGDEAKAHEFLLKAPSHERSAAMKAATASLGWNFDMTATDEAHSLLSRDGKADSAMANAIDALTDNSEYHIGMSADPVKNDASEAFSVLKKVAPERYVDDEHPSANQGTPGVTTKSDFARRYSTNTDAAHEALQREMSAYQYAESAPPDVQVTRHNAHDLELTPPQKADYDAVSGHYSRARSARMRGGVDVEAVKALSPNSFAQLPADQHEARAKELSQSLGMLRDAAYNRVVNMHPQGAKIDHLRKRLKEMPPSKHPKIIFAKHHGSVDAIYNAVKAEGHRVGLLTGKMTGREKEAERLKFSPQWDAKANGGQGAYASIPEYDVIVCSDAAAVGGNMQRGSHVINYDREVTAMTHHQRNGRAYRTGQRNAVTLESLGTNTDYEKRCGQIYNQKNRLREYLTTPSELMDDTGLAHRIKDAREKAVASSMQSNESGVPAPPVAPDGLPQKRTRKAKIIVKATATGYPLQGRRKFRGLDISIEQRKGGVRSGVDSDGHEWRVKMTAPYGYIRRTEGVDHDHVDCYLGPNEAASDVYIIDINDPKTGDFDEQKCFLGFDSAEAAKKVFFDNYDNPKFFRSLKSMPYSEFEDKVLATLPKGGAIVKSLAVSAPYDSIEGVLTALGLTHVRDVNISGYSTSDFVPREIWSHHKPREIASKVAIELARGGHNAWMETKSTSGAGEVRVLVRDPEQEPRTIVITPSSCLPARYRAIAAI